MTNKYCYALKLDNIMLHRSNHLFWTDVHNDRMFIWRSNLDDGSDATPLIDTGAIKSNTVWWDMNILTTPVSIISYLQLWAVDIAVDWVTDKIYWTANDQIKVYDLRRGYQTTVIKSTEPGTSLKQVVVDSTTRLWPQQIYSYSIGYSIQVTLLEWCRL